jgi:hypothetical protein|tara:strand:+ start:157 stop:348 length:192 start_codon:yes stop_codon:yes gene_type:complete
MGRLDKLKRELMIEANKRVLGVIKKEGDLKEYMVNQEEGDKDITVGKSDMDKHLRSDKGIGGL